MSQALIQAGCYQCPALGMRWIVFIFLLIGFQSNAQLRFTKEVDTIAQLKTLNTADINKSCNVKGYLVPNDGGGGLFNADQNSVAATDDGIVILPNSGIGRWRRVVAGRDYHALWWGGIKTNSVLQAAADWVSANGWGKVIADGGSWILKCDDSTRFTMKTGVTLVTAEDSQLECAPNPSDHWIMVDFPFGTHDAQVGPARLIGWNLTPPGGDLNKTGKIFSLQDTENIIIGGIRASNWWSQYIDVGSNNLNFNIFDDQWQLGARSFGAQGDGITVDTRSVQDYENFCERYTREMFFPTTTNGYLISNIQITNAVAVKVRGEKTLIKAFYSNPTEGVLPHPSGAFIVSADNCSFESIRFVTVGPYPVTETNAPNTGFFVPLNIHIATNTLVKNCEFDVESGKGIVSSGTYTRIESCFFNRCGITFGLGNRQDWLYYEATSPFKGQKYSPLSPSVINCTFSKGSPYKHTMFFSAADDLLFSGNKLLDMNTVNPLLIYSGDEGTTDARGTNVYRFSGKVVDNTITGTNFGPNGAITLRLNTPTNYVLPTFITTNVYSAVQITGNHIYGSGTVPYTGIQLIAAPGTIIEGNDVKVTGTPIHFVGNCNGVTVRGNPRLEDTILGIAGTFVFSEGFEAPPSFSDLVFEDNTVISSVSDEYAWRNIEPIHFRNLTLRNNKWIFNGAAGSGDAPRIIQSTLGEGFHNITGNYFYLTNAMSDRRVAYFQGTNLFVTFDKNHSLLQDGSTCILRGPSATVVSFHAIDNHVGGMEFNGVKDLILEGNHLTSESAYPYPLEINNSDRAIVLGNFITNLFAGDSFCAVIKATNSTFENNIVVGNSGSVLAVSANGEMLVGNNVIRNIGVGNNFVGVSPPGTKSHIVYKQPMNIDIGASTGVAFSTHRDGSPATNSIQVNNWFTGSSRDAQYRVDPDNSADLAGHAFFVHKTAGTTQFAFGVHGSTPPTIYLGDSTNAINHFLGGLGTNTLLYLDDNRFLQRLTLGANMTFTAGTLNSVAGGGGGSTNDTPWALDHDANQFSLTNAFKVTLRHADASAVALTVSNLNASSTYGIDTLGNAIINSGGSGSMKVQLVGADSLKLSAAALTPGGSSKALGIVGDAWTQAVVGPSGINIGGITIFSGSGSPEGVITAPVGSWYYRTNGGAGTISYGKESGVLATGWVAYKSSATGTIPTTVAIACSDLTTTITAGTYKGYIRLPFAFTLTSSSVSASLAAAQTSGALFTFDVNEAGVSILSTKGTFDNNEKTTSTAVTASVVSDLSIAAFAEISVDVDTAGVGPAGLIVVLDGFR